MHMAGMREKRAAYPFESSWKKRYSDRGVQRMLERYTVFCATETCPDKGRVGAGNIGIHSQQKRRYRCTTSAEPSTRRGARPTIACTRRSG